MLSPYVRIVVAYVSATTKFVENAHAAGLQVHPYTFRAENSFLPINYRIGTEIEATRFDGINKEIEAFLLTGIDGFFTDQTNFGVKAREEFLKRHSN